MDETVSFVYYLLVVCVLQSSKCVVHTGLKFLEMVLFTRSAQQSIWSSANVSNTLSSTTPSPQLSAKLIYHHETPLPLTNSYPRTLSKQHVLNTDMLYKTCISTNIASQLVKLLADRMT